MNLIDQNLSQLIRWNYVRKADPEGNYWFDFSRKKLAKIRQELKDGFCLILRGASNVNDDYFVFPFKIVEHLFLDEYLASPKKKGGDKTRWIGYIRDMILHVNNCSV